MVGEQQIIATCVVSILKRRSYSTTISEAGSCRLKRNATPSLFKLTCNSLSYKTIEDPKCRVEMPEDNLSGKISKINIFVSIFCIFCLAFACPIVLDSWQFCFSSIASCFSIKRRIKWLIQSPKYTKKSDYKNILHSLPLSTN